MGRASSYYNRNEPRICSFFIRGECRRGAECAYRHEMPAQQNIEDRLHRISKPVVLKGPNKAGNMSSVNPAEDKNNRTLYVEGVYPSFSEQDIMDHFSAYGELESIVMVPTRYIYALVTFMTRKGAQKAAKDLTDNLVIKGVPMSVKWGTPAAIEEIQQAVVTSQQHNQMVQPPRTEQRPPPLVQYAPMDLPRAGAAIPPKDETSGGSDPSFLADNLVGQDVNVNTAEEEVELPSEGVSEGRLPEAMSAEERVMKRKKGSSTSTSTSTPPVSPLPVGVDVAAQVGLSVAVGESSPLTPFVTSFIRDTLLFPMHSLETKSEVEITKMTLKALQASLLSRRQILAQQDEAATQNRSLKEAVAAAEARTAAAEARAAAAEARTAAAEARAAAAEARAAAAEAREAVAASEEARKAREALLATVDAQYREMREKIVRGEAWR